QPQLLVSFRRFVTPGTVAPLPIPFARLGWLLDFQRRGAELSASVNRGLDISSDALRIQFLLDTARSLLALAAELASVSPDTPHRRSGAWRSRSPGGAIDLDRESPGRVESFLRAERRETRLVGWLLPGRLRVLAFEAPIDDLDGFLDVGVCLMLAGEDAEPGHVVCNVGHLPTADDGDLRATVRSSLKIMEELAGVPACQGAGSLLPAPGFVANVLCVLPKSGPRRLSLSPSWQSIRQVNLSVWTSDEHATAWYKQSRAHASILAQHAQGKLRTDTAAFLILYMVLGRPF
ncbi:unnamed protein product, partial [Effrenium voratum]